MSTESPRPYRTVIRATIVQESPLAAGGGAPDEAEPDACLRDGLGRLTLPGASLAGALVETASRLQPDLVPDPGSEQVPFAAVTGKRRGRPTRAARGATAERFLQSVWTLENAHVDGPEPETEWRQGVGIRQATGAATRDKGALFDFEIVPTGTRWTFQLEVDTHREGGVDAEALALLALDEWARGRLWLGGRAARGSGWCRLADPHVVRLAGTRETVLAWPDNTCEPATALARLEARPENSVLAWNEAVEAARARLAPPEPLAAWHYVRFDVALEVAAPAEGDYGWSPLRIGGHPCRLDPDAAEGRWEPRSGDPEERDLDRPHLRTGAGGDLVPALPGASARGPLRHGASRLLRQESVPTRDPNDPDDPLGAKLRDKVRQLRDSTPAFGSDDVRLDADLATRWLGAEELASHVLLRDAAFEGEASFVRLQRHAEDEFTAGVYGNAKFDTEVLAEGRFRFPIVVELPPYRPPFVKRKGAKKTTPESDLLARLAELDQWLLPALEQAGLGHLPVGGNKWSGCGWIPWRVEAVTVERAGEPDAEPLEVLGEWLERARERVLGEVEVQR